MSTFDEMTKEKQRISDALARNEIQREKLAGKLGEPDAAERVLARYNKGRRAKKDGFSQDVNRTDKIGDFSAGTSARAHCGRKARWQ
jgi:hypothetical protein